MFRRKRRNNKTVNGTPPGTPPSVPVPNSGIPSPTTIGVCYETKTYPLLTDVFKGNIEKAADRSKSALVSEGKIKPMAFFVHADGTMKTVSLSLRDEHLKEALIRKIREKALAEDASAVIILTAMDHKHGVILSGVSSGMRGSACVDYNFDNQKKTVISWKISWLNQPVQNVFLDGIFDETG